MVMTIGGGSNERRETTADFVDAARSLAGWMEGGFGGDGYEQKKKKHFAARCGEEFRRMGRIAADPGVDDETRNQALVVKEELREAGNNIGADVKSWASVPRVRR